MPYQGVPILILVDKSEVVKKDAQAEFNIVGVESDMPGNIFLNQEGPTHWSTKGAIVETKMVDSTNNSMYFMKVIREGVS